MAGDYNKGYATSDGLVMDLQALKELAAKTRSSRRQKATAYNQVLVKAADLKSVPEVESRIKALGYETSSYEDMRKSLEEQSRAIQLILGGIGAVSLLVAAIGHRQHNGYVRNRAHARDRHYEGAWLLRS